MKKSNEQGDPFFGTGHFEWQFPNPDRARAWKHYSYDENRWWGSFPAGLKAGKGLEAYSWALGPFTRYPGNPILAPSPGEWDEGRHDGGVHNGSILVKDDRFYYVYRGESPLDRPMKTPVDYICDIGIAVSDDGIHITKDTEHSPLFRKGDDRRYSYEDVSIAKHDGIYYLFCNQWLWENMSDPSINGTFLAVSNDLLTWEKVGIVFPDARRIHRNAVVVQNPSNEAVRIEGRFMMYINDGLVAYSDDMIHWESREIEHRWPGGEGCFALADHFPERPDDLLLFTGGHHTGHFYAVGEVLFSKQAPESPRAYLPRPILAADPAHPHENGFSCDDPERSVSCYADCIFFNGLTLHDGRWWLYYGGSEYYTCLATLEV